MMETYVAGDENCRGTGGKLAQEVSLLTWSPGFELFSDWSKNPIRISRILEYCNAIG